MVNKKNIIVRVGENFQSEIEEIKEERLKRKIDKKKKSTRRLTNLITQHKGWAKIKEDTIEVILENE